MFLSIIIPIYNAEKYLKRCIDSILHQGLLSQEYEVLLIDDGSMDNSPDLCMEYCNQMPNFRYYRKSNSGVSDTRNMGIDLANGEYLHFIDADDYMASGGEAFLKNSMLEKDIDILMFSSITLDRISLKSFKENANISGDVTYYGDGLQFFIERHPYFVWNYWVKRKFLIDNKIRFKPLVIGEDSLFNLELFMCSPTVKCTDANIYRYVENGGSAISSRDKVFMKKCIKSYLELFCAFKKQIADGNKDIIIAMLGHVPHFMSRCLSADLTMKEFKDIRNEFIQSKHVDLIKASIKRCGVIALPLKHTALYVPAKFCFVHIYLKFIKKHIGRN